MPFRDPERKKQYQKEYKARLQEAKARAQSPPIRKVFLCVRYPSLRIGNIQFRDCFYVTDSLEDQRMIENSEYFGTCVVAWRCEPNPGPGNGHGFVL